MAARTLTHHFWMHEFLQVGFTESSIPVISDVSSVHDLPEKIAQVLPRHLHGLEKTSPVSWWMYTEESNVSTAISPEHCTITQQKMSAHLKSLFSSLCRNFTQAIQSPSERALIIMLKVWQCNKIMLLCTHTDPNVRQKRLFLSGRS